MRERRHEMSPEPEPWPPIMTWVANATRVEDREYPWDNEVDDHGDYLMSMEWTTNRNLNAYASRDPVLGHWSGFVAVLPGHTLHGCGTPNVDADRVLCLPPLLDIPGGVHDCVPGGIKYAGVVPDLGKDLWWLGYSFDNPHDYTPGLDMWNPGIDYHDATWPSMIFSDVEKPQRRIYRTLDDVVTYANRLSDVLTRSSRPQPGA
jgi:hypothetical protein